MGGKRGASVPSNGSDPCYASCRRSCTTSSLEGTAGRSSSSYPRLRGPTGTVLHDGHAYSMPPEAISMPGTLYVYANRVRIVAGRYEVVRPRKFVPHEGSTLTAHRAAIMAAMSCKRDKRYLKRQQLLDLGEPAFHYLSGVITLSRCVARQVSRCRHWP